MFGSALTIVCGALLVWTMPDGPEALGARAVIGLLGVGFNGVAITKLVVWCIRERATLARVFRDFRGLDI